jgi:ribonuclease HI
MARSRLSSVAHLKNQRRRVASRTVRRDHGPETITETSVIDSMIEIYVDGLAEPTNPGIGTYGFVVFRDGRVLTRGHGFDGNPVSNNHAEYAGLVRALSEVTRHADEEVVVRTDSKMVANQMSGDWKVSKKAFNSKSEWSYVDKYLEAKEVAKRFSKITFVWIPREQNSEADELSRVAYREQLRKR